MNSTNSILTRHSIDIDHIIIEYLLKYKRGNELAFKFQERVADEFQEKIKTAGLKSLGRSINNAADPLSKANHYNLAKSVASINGFAFQNLKKVMKRVSN